MVTDCPSDQAPAADDRASSARRPRGQPEERELGLRIALDGRWYYLGSPIDRLELVKLFASVLRREADGSYWLVTPVERGRIAVEDVPFVAVELMREGAGRDQRVRLRSNLDEWVTLGPDHPLRWRRPGAEPPEAGPIPYVEFGPGLEARLARPVYYELVELADEGPHGAGGGLGVWSAGEFFAIGDVGS